MLIQYASDLHLEFPENENHLRRCNLEPCAEVLILAGDIDQFNLIGERTWFFDYLSENFKTTYWLPGNHEYYHYDLSRKSGSFFENIRHNIHLVNDYAVTVENVRIILSTLWTTVKPNHQISVERRINDYHLIRNNGRRLTCEDLQKEHEQSLAFIKYELSRKLPLKKVVATHHVPTFINYPPQYFGDILNEAFAVNLTSLIVSSGPDYWIYGHHHENITDFKLGNTLMVTNQLGYIRDGEDRIFSNCKTLDVG